MRMRVGFVEGEAVGMLDGGGGGGGSIRCILVKEILS